MEPVPAGDSVFTRGELNALEATIRQAELDSRVEFSVFVGNAEGDPRAFATSLHNTLVAPARSILIMVDPQRRALEVVTGGWVRRNLTDAEVELAALAMQRAFAEGELLDGLRAGINLLAEHARTPRTLHAR